MFLFKHFFGKTLRFERFLGIFLFHITNAQNLFLQACACLDLSCNCAFVHSLGESFSCFCRSSQGFVWVVSANSKRTFFPSTCPGTTDFASEEYICSGGAELLCRQWGSPVRICSIQTFFILLSYPRFNWMLLSSLFLSLRCSCILVSLMFEQRHLCGFEQLSTSVDSATSSLNLIVIVVYIV